MRKAAKPVPNTVRIDSDLIGRPALLRTAAMQFPVIVQDVRYAYGRRLLLVVPDDERPNLGQAWVNQDRVTMDAP